MTDLGSGRTAAPVKTMSVLLENAEYHECACFINRMKGKTLRAIVHELPAAELNDALPASRCVVEGLYLKMSVLNLSIDCLQPERTVVQVIRWITADIKDSPSASGFDPENANPYMAQIRNILRVIAVRRPDIREKLYARQRVLKRCLQILVSRRTVDTSDFQRMTLPEALKLEVRKHISHLKQTLEKLELCMDKRHLLKATNTTNLRPVNRNNIQDRLFSNKSLLNAFEPIRNYSQLTCLLQALQSQIQSDKDVLLTFTELRKQMQTIPMNCALETVFQRYIAGYGRVVNIMLETAPSARNWVSMNDINLHTDNLGQPPMFSSNWHIAVNNDAFSDSTDGSEVTPEKASEATETIEEVSTPMGCTQGHEFPDEDDFPLPRSLPVTTATNGIAIERTTADPYEPFSMPAPTTVPPTVDNSEVVNLRNEVHVLKKELARCRDTVAKVNDREKKLKDRLSEQAQKQFLKGPTKFEDISVGAVRPTELIRSFGNLYTEARVEAFDALDDVPQMTGFDDLKGKLLFSIVVLSFRSVQQEILLIKRKIRDLLHMPETSGDPDVAPDDPLDEMAKELETMMSDYFRRTVRKQDIQKNIEEVSQQMCQTLYDYPGLKDSDGLKLYTEEVVRLAWALSVQNPPLFIVYDFKIFKPDELVRFHSSDPDSNEVKAVLWPALQEGIGGSIVHKAVVIT